MKLNSNIQVNDEVKITSLYIITGSLWILFSDELINILIQEKIITNKFQTIKSWAYILITATIFYSLIHRALHSHKFLFENAGTAIVIIDEDTKISMINEKAGVLLNYTPEEVIGRSFKDFIAEEEDIEKLVNYHNLRRKSDKALPDKYEIKLLDNSGNYKYALIQVNMMPNSNKSIVSVIDITERKQAEDKVKYMNYHDAVTKLYNRKFYEEELKRLDVPRQLPLSIILGDANGLKLTNDIFGHQVGDQLLRKIAEVIKECTREEDIVARWGGDEFGIILSQTGQEETERIISRIKSSCERSDFEPIPPNIALGSATKEEIGQDLNEIFDKAEAQMYQDKFEHKNCSSNPLLQALLCKLEDSNYEIVGHASRMVDLAKKFGKELELTEQQIERLALLAKFHDIGKFTVEKTILIKDSPLNEKEWEKFKSHSSVGYEIASNFRKLNAIANYIYHHHENWDGSGYPQGLQGREIPLLSRIIHIIDFYDAITHGIYYQLDKETYYTTTMTQMKAIKKLNEYSGELFDPKYVEKFIKFIVNFE
ncbi:MULTISPECIES: HD-GYP domain-containing protein [unclassified Candidatus Frackibacter]|uniref:HD-GYP domain-containing protein n=1 Tax=unclassified Candidatus Frackibacter TaxID=2648818 RepID=UPI0008900F8A|nr:MULTISPECIES: diguanylate cyclase [unclassified Candidatus Frackibacter]SDC74381.1 PAS domain S-box-containing protein/diguanylate cyclase (GGDEF) domain-containing protein [Candidatus Frackibacter sp. WG11]SEM88357.1 PAS domain S-box-containing protein/diguanylate cyclase (GGDEF) domain-containing protein [Candidatus Frackibacter sp. WG12]SFL97760.1 PAS domain S-box-containing protein/diguanylate cyclase (GGDEF) domain-containing protein [Candidatus Frackibacter sp. WG13]